jgi:hypothetical protein
VEDDGLQSETLVARGDYCVTVCLLFPPQMYGDILMFLPATIINMRRLGIDFDIPISQAESIRKDIQCFLILRALYSHVTKLSFFSKDTITTGVVQ